MGLFGDNQPTKDYGGRINELKTKIEQLRSVGMTASADRLQKELDKIDRPILEKTKPMSVGQLKNQLKSVKASGVK
jgi:hypothetical protein